MRRSCILLILCLGIRGGLTYAEELPGIVKEKPADGFSVKTDQGWMVPYDAKIPGTEIVFRMMPIPGGEFTMGSPDAEADRKADEGP